MGIWMDHEIRLSFGKYAWFFPVKTKMPNRNPLLIGDSKAPADP